MIVVVVVVVDISPYTLVPVVVVGELEGGWRGRCGLTFAPTPFFLGAVVFLTPTGLLPAAVDVVVAAGVVAVADFVLGAAAVRLMAGAVSTVWKTRGLELPVAERVPSRGILGFFLGFFFSFLDVMRVCIEGQRKDRIWARETGEADDV